MFARYIGLCLAMAVWTEAASAGGSLAVDLGLLYYTRSQITETNDNSKLTSTTKDQHLHGGACYLFTSSVCIGLKYVSKEEERTVKSESAFSDSESSSTAKWTGTGISLGLINNEWNLRASYLFDGKYASGESQYYGGACYQLELGYGFKVKSAMIGPQLSFARFSYSKVKTGSTESTLDNDLSDEWIAPSFGMWLML